VKRSGRDEPMWVVIHMCIEAMLGILISNYQKHHVFLIISYNNNYFPFNKIGEQGGGTGWGAEMAQTMYTHMSKCKNDKMVIKKKAEN
jgi:hypothetical protein